MDELGLHGQISAEAFLREREEALDAMFPTAQLLPGAGGRCCPPSAVLGWPLGAPPASCLLLRFAHCFAAVSLTLGICWAGGGLAVAPRLGVAAAAAAAATAWACQLAELKLPAVPTLRRSAAAAALARQWRALLPRNQLPPAAL